MITKEGYSKDPEIIPEGIVVTWGGDIIKESGGLRSFITLFLKYMAEDEDNLWCHTVARKPTAKTIQYVYIIVAKRLAYRLNFVEYDQGEILMCGPIVKCPFKRELRGFQNFRYCTKLF